MVRGTSVSEDVFLHVSSHLPRNSFLVFNDTRVIRARLLFEKQTGSRIEIFCLDPIEPSETETAFHATGHSVWKCLVGNSKRWKRGTIEFRHQGIKATGQQGSHAAIQQPALVAERGKTLPDGSFEILFRWEPRSMTFSELLQVLGHIPLPPYIRREDIPEDNDRYQTIYALHEGSVAAPTAGLHFTEAVLDKLRNNGCAFGYVTLHVGAGTFRPVTEEEVTRHVMHREKISVTAQTIGNILSNRRNGLTAVGTTATRTLESLYWAGVKLLTGEPAVHPEVSQWDPYDDRHNRDIPAEEALEALLEYLKQNDLSEYRAETQLMILPGYTFRLVDSLLTNFHMPRSTLLLLVSAFAGDTWRAAYRFALGHDFRFLSYGDACLFLR